MSNEKHDFWADKGDVLLSRHDREIWHVMNRYKDIDEDTPEWGKYYRLADESHTCYQHMSGEDIKSEFIKIGENVTGKPIQADEMRAWYDE